MTTAPSWRPLEPVWGYGYGEDDQQAAMAFFAVFARFEFALKASGFARGKEGERADVAWEGYANAIGNVSQGMVHVDAVQAAIKYLCTEPPKQQRIEIRGGRKFAQYSHAAPSAQPRTDLKTALLVAKDVRNNLFHGGKLMREETDPDRNRRLMHTSLLVLSAALPILDEVQVNYWTR
jgi:hypothetical protein